MSESCTILPFRPEFTEQVISLIVGIQHDEFGVQITAADQPDLANIPDFYQNAGGNFWVALDGDRVLGTIALRDIGNREGALRKMFVAPEARGKEAGVARRLLLTLLVWAKEHGIRQIYLGTTDKFLAAHRFYEKNGFRAIEPEHLPQSFPRMVQDTKYYEIELDSSYEQQIATSG